VSTILEKRNDSQTELEESIHAYSGYIREIKCLCNDTVKLTLYELKRFSLYLAERFGSMQSVKLAGITSIDIIQYLAKAGCCKAKATVFKKLSILKGFFQYLDGMEKIEKDPTRWLKGPRLDRLERLPGFLTPTEVERLIHACFSPSNRYSLRDYTMIVLLYGTGIRASEVTRVTIDSVDLERRLLRICSDKTCMERFVPLVPLVHEALQQYLQHRLVSGSQSTALFLSRYGRPLNINTVTIRIRNISLEAGLKKKVTASLLRHTCATHLLEYSNQTIPLIAKWLGHSCLENTMIYTHVSDKEARKAVRAHPINSMLKKYPPILNKKLRKAVKFYAASRRAA
jgi:site-specific recombinase XerD